MAKQKKLSRLMRLSGLGAKVSSSYMGQRITSAFRGSEAQKDNRHKLHLKNAERIVETMGVLKGAAMKVGQSLAVIADSMDLPSDVSDVLSKLHNKAEPVPFDEIRAVIEAECRQPIDSIFSRIDPEPLGTASLAQAHAAWLIDGTAVVIKVLHDGVEQSVDIDLNALKSIMLAARFVKRSKEEIDLIFSEIRERLLEELDYENEAQNLLYFHKAFESLPGLNAPKPFIDLCTGRILVMERMLGSTLGDFLQSASDEAKRKAGETLSIAFHEMVYVHRSLHADPHGGNYLFQPDGTVSIIDFGCVKNFDSQFVHDYGQMASALIHNDRNTMLYYCRKLEILLGENPEADEALWRFGNVLAKPFRMASYQAGSADDTLLTDLKAEGKAVLACHEIRSSRDVIFLHRALTGIYSMLRRLEYERDYEELRSRYTKQAIDVYEGEAIDRGRNNVG